MRYIVEGVIPGEAGNRRIMDGSLSSKMKKYLDAVKPEAVYFTVKDGQHDYILHFPAGGLPPNNASWSLTMTNTTNPMVNNSINRYNVGTYSNLTLNADGPVNIYIQNAPPSGNESNWLPAPGGNFKLWLRAYLPDTAVLNGTYRVPPVVEVNSA